MYLIVQAARFGDLIQTKRLILSVLTRGSVHLLVDAALAPLAKLLYPKTTVHTFHFHGVMNEETLSLNRQTLAGLRDIPFTQVYNCNYSGLTAAVCRLFEPALVIGNRPRSAFIERSPLLRRISRMTAHRKSSCCNIEDVWAHYVEDPVPPAAVNPVPRAGGRGIGVVVAGRENRRSLPPETICALLTIYANQADCRRIVLLGTQSEKKSAQAICRSLAPSLQKLVLDLTGKTDWPRLIEAVTDLDCVLSPDTGTMHLAAHLGVPVRAFFFSSASCHETGPYGAGHTVWQACPPCAPCLEAAPCPNNTLCIASLNDRFFLRAVALGDKAEPPKNVLCLTSDFDELGLVYRATAGTDPKADFRNAERAFLSSAILHKALRADTARLSREEDELLREIFAQDSDWMLPPDRYL
ncbi:MAG: heptosyltransferase [Desulfovibrionaceae bacterium]|nr:heptosyltransferase [Desulfovibrionaceae bacterium]